MIRSRIQNLVASRRVLLCVAASVSIFISLWLGEAVVENLPIGISSILSGILVVLLALVIEQVLARGYLSVSPRLLLRRVAWGLLIATTVLVSLDTIFVVSRDTPGGKVKDVSSKSPQFVELVLFTAYLTTLLGLGAGVGVMIRPSRLSGFSNLWVRVEPAGQGTYRVSARDDVGGESSATFHLPESLQSLEEFTWALEEPRRGSESFQESARMAPKAIGSALFETVFQGNVRASLYSALKKDKDQVGDPERLRIRLSLQHAPKLAALPWEYLYDEENYGFFAQSRATPIVRSLESVQPYKPLRVRPPLRILVVVAQPKGLDRLEVETELRHIQDALQDLEPKLIVVEPLRRATWEALTMRLRDKKRAIHVLHFIGHGAFTEDEEGALAFENAMGERAPNDGDSLASALRDHPSLRLAVLNACHGATASESKALAGVAQRLLVSGQLPAVVAMQTAITDSTARSFARWFYDALAYGYPLDVALSEVRKLLAGQGNKEWGTPVLYLRAPDANLFDVKGRKPKRWEESLREERERAGQDSSED